MTLEKNYHNWPCRTLKWGSPLHRSIQISLKDEKDRTYGFEVVVWEDREAERYWKRQPLLAKSTIEEISSNIIPLLEKGRDIANSWGSEDLEFATKLG